MRLIEVFLPLAFPNGEPVPEPIFELLTAELTEKFGHVLAYLREPITRSWSAEHSEPSSALAVLEVLMADDYEKDWWKDFRHRIEALLHDHELLIRVTVVEQI